MNTKQSASLLASFSDEMAGLVESAGESVFSVAARRRFPASGFAIADNLMITADHVIEQEDNILVGNAVDNFSASLVGRDPQHDLALLKVERIRMKPLTPASEPARVGSLTLALARPGRTIQASLGVLSSSGEWSFRREKGTRAILRAEVSAYPGFSGGPLIDVNGAVLGLNTSAISMGGLATLSMAFIQGAIDQLKTYGHVRQGYLGVRFQVVELGSEQVKLLAREQKTGLLVSGIEENSPAAKGKLQVGDILIGLGGEVVYSIETLQAILSGDRIGKVTSIELLRGGLVQMLEVEIGER